MNSSAILALIYDEPSAAMVRPRLQTGVMSAVNYAEVIARLIERTLPLSEAIQLVAFLVLTVMDFTEARAARSATLRPLTRSAGLSLADWACLALDAELDADVLAADRPWATVEQVTGVRVVLIGCSLVWSSGSYFRADAYGACSVLIGARKYFNFLKPRARPSDR